MSEYKIKLENLIKDFRKTRALDNINLEIYPGEYIVILGKSGAGKTTLLKLISGLIKPSSGVINVDGIDITKKPPEDRQIAYLPQDYALFPHMTVWDNVGYSPKLQGKSSDKISELCKEILGMIHLSERPDAMPQELSGGMKQRTALGRSIATNFNILLLDEPLRALDARLRIELRTELRKLARDLNFTVIHVTHDQEEAMSIADRIVVLHNGRILQIGTQEEIYLKPQNPFVASFLSETNKWEAKVIKSTGINLNSIKINNIDNYKPVFLYTLIDDFGNHFYSLSQSEFSPEEKIIMVIKSEAIKAFKAMNIESSKSSSSEISKNQGLAEKLKKFNLFTGNIKRIFYLGKWTNLEIQLQNVPDQDPLWTIKIPSRRATRLELDDEIKLRIKPQFVFLYKRGGYNT